LKEKNDRLLLLSVDAGQQHGVIRLANHSEVRPFRCKKRHQIRRYHPCRWWTRVVFVQPVSSNRTLALHTGATLSYSGATWHQPANSRRERESFRRQNSGHL